MQGVIFHIIATKLIIISTYYKKNAIFAPNSIMMSETMFSNFEPVENGQPQQNQADTVINSKDYQDIRLLTASRFGASRVFTAKSGAKKVIIKALKAELMNDPKCKANLRKEYEITTQLDHKYIRKAIDLVTIQGLGECIIFEYIEGKSLAEHVRVGTLTEKQVKNILAEVCDGLYYMHRNQVVHCDLKPENIIVTEGDYKAKIIDIGLPETEYKTNKELLIKEMEFIAPELIKGEDCDARSDVYSMGKIMEFINERNISRQFNSIATHCIQFSKEQRYDSISEVKSAITKGHSVVKIFIITLILCALGTLAIVYVPKIKAKAEEEKTERRKIDFTHEIERIEGNTEMLCEKYKLTSLNEPISANWTEDSLAYYQALTPFFDIENLKDAAMEVLHEQKAIIDNRRQLDFENLLLSSFKTADDSLAVALKSAIPEQNDSLLIIEAFKWFGQQH